jgi:ferredoxin/coenzyme F420-reducing hydrogenase delta subunit
MTLLQKPLRAFFAALETGLDRIFGTRLNPLYHLGALGFFLYWVVAVTGIYLYVFFDTGITAAYESVEYLTHDQWYLGGVMRSLHRYASDAMVLFMVIHIFREYALDRHRGARWFTWSTGTPILFLVFVCGITGYWLVWDELAQYVAIRTTEWLDWLPIFVTPIATNFLTPQQLDDRFFTLMIYLHIAAPLILLLILWIHLARVTRAETNPPRGLAVGMFAAMLVLSLVKPAVSHAPADLTTVVSVVRLDWYYLGLYPLLDYWSSGTVWATVAIVLLLLTALPWLPPMRRARPALVTLDQCNGCTRCAADCPFNAIAMGPRTDGKKFDWQAVVSASKCVSCGICVGSCPTSTPFRRRAELVSGIDLPDRSLADIRAAMHEAADRMSGATRILVFGCAHGARLRNLSLPGAAAVELPCIGNLPPSFIDYALSDGLADGVLLAGCSKGDCYHRFGIDWTLGRLEGTRDPHLRERVPRERIAHFWGTPAEAAGLRGEIERFAAALDALPKPQLPKRDGPPPAPRRSKATSHA